MTSTAVITSRTVESVGILDSDIHRVFPVQSSSSISSSSLRVLRRVGHPQFLLQVHRCGATDN